VRVACPPIIAPCFYGIDMSTVSELFAPRFMQQGRPEEEAFAAMASELGADSLRYLPTDAIARALNHPADQLCRACLTGDYPTAHGQQLYQIALGNACADEPCDPTESPGSRTYESPVVRS
jgi:amidophosphoribosyltransferase